MYYFHVFDSNQEYTDTRYDSYKEPWIGVMRASSGNVTFNRGELEQPLTFIIKTSGNLYWKYAGSASNAKTIEYRIWNNKRQAGEWVSVTSTTGGTAIPVTAGDRVEFRGDNNTYSISASDWNGFDPTSGRTSAQFDICGNIMSLIQKDGFETLDTLAQPHALRNMFIRSNVVDASKLILPATGLTTNCYTVMFKGCTRLTGAPKLPATTLAESCYSNMFQGCTSLTTAPDLPAQTLVASCYSNMFNGCSLLNHIECLATDINASGSLSNWVSGVSATGTFIKAAGMTGWGTGASGIPANWVVMDEGTWEEPDYTLHESTHLVRSEMLRIPDSLGIRQFNEHGDGPYADWVYLDGIFLKGVIDTYVEYNSTSYDLNSLLDYVGHYYGTKINDSGAIDSRYDNTQLDDKEPGMALFTLYDLTGLQKYKLCLDMLYDNDFSTITKNIDGVFYHKVGNYDRQGWLDGLYMGEPFRAEYAKRFLTGSAQAAVYDDVVYQITKLTEKTYDSTTGLYRHAYDSSAREGETPAQWVDPNSVNGEQAYYAWSRALGWTLMTIVDVLEILPDSHTGRTSLTNLLSGMCQSILTYRDSTTGVWRNVPTEPASAGTVNQNGFESSSSAMFAYAWLKGVRLGYLPASERTNAISIYQSIKNNFFRTETLQGETVLTYTSVCRSGNPGTADGCNTKEKVYANYCEKEFFDNNTHGFAPAIYAALEYERLTNS